MKNRVALMTIHLARIRVSSCFCCWYEKIYFICDEYEHTIRTEEERRLFYVALTRAEHQAYLTYAQSRYRWGN
jgi:DNA helicase-2/ATP-dependent DNA helicase PcrA